MTDTSLGDKEKFVCLNCYTVAPLSDSLRCSSCNSDSVVSAETLQNAVTEPESRHRVTPSQQATMPRAKQKWYRIQCGLFETVISYTKALSREEALIYAASPFCEWHRIKDVSDEIFNGASFETTELDHNEFLEWCRKMWPLST